MQVIVGEVARTEARNICTTDNDSTGPAQILDRRAVFSSNRLLESDHAVRSGPAGVVDIYLDCYWNAMQGSQFLARPNSFIRVIGSDQCFIGKDINNGVDDGIDFIEPGKTALDRLSAQNASRPDAPRKFSCAPCGELLIRAAQFLDPFRTQE
jgi:hypothetical protein